MRERIVPIRIKRHTYENNHNFEYCIINRGTFLSLNKKVPKEVSLGEALSVALPRAKAALP